MLDTQTDNSDLSLRLRERLELPKAVLSQLRETCLFNQMIDSAINDLDEAINLLSESDLHITKGGNSA